MLFKKRDEWAQALAKYDVIRGYCHVAEMVK
jgi:hypothetical protein